MNGQQIWNCITAITTNKAIYDFVKQLKDEDNKETLMVGIEIIANNIDLLLVTSDSETLRTAVLKVAEDNGAFAGFPFVANELLPVEDENHEDAEDGLSWVAWSDLWDALAMVAEFNPNYLG